MLATTSVGLVIRTFRSARREATEMGQAVLMAAILADFLTVIGFTIFALIRQHGACPALQPALLAIMAKVLLILRWRPGGPAGFSQLFTRRPRRSRER